MCFGLNVFRLLPKILNVKYKKKKKNINDNWWFVSETTNRKLMFCASAVSSL